MGLHKREPILKQEKLSLTSVTIVADSAFFFWKIIQKNEKYKTFEQRLIKKRNDLLGRYQIYTNATKLMIC